MNSSRYPVVADNVRRGADSDNPFCWAASVGQESEGALESGGAQNFGFESARGKTSRVGWWDRVKGLLFRSKPKNPEVKVIDIEIKRNDLWESDWEVQVAYSEPVTTNNRAESGVATEETTSDSWLKRRVGNCLKPQGRSEGR